MLEVEKLIFCLCVCVRPHRETTQTHTHTHKTSGSFHSLDVWLGILGSGERAALESAWHCKRLVSTMAHYERFLTHRL